MKILNCIFGKSQRTNFSKRLIFNCLILACFCLASCSNGNVESKDVDSERFLLESQDLKCFNNEITRVPFSGKTYVIEVKAASDVTWSVTVESDNLLTVSPTNSQKGNGKIEVVAANNPNKVEGRVGKINIKNSDNDIEFKLLFEQKEKEIFFPDNCVGNKQTNEDYKNPAKDFNIHYMVEGENIALLWHRSFGLNPTKFNKHKALEAAEETYSFLLDQLGFSDRITSSSNKTKLLMFVQKENQGSAYAYPDDKSKVTIINLGPNHLITSEENNRYGIFYHEMSHCFQFMAYLDGAFHMSGPINEMTSQWTLLRKFPNWMDLETGHFNAFMGLTHLAFLHEENGYHSPYVLEYWENKRGPKFVSRIWKEAIESDGNDPVATYKRISGLSQEQFNDDMFEACTRFITWDIPSIKEYSAKYANKHTCKLINVVNDMTYRITAERCPQNYGYNGIKLVVPPANTKVTLNFKGLVGIQGFNVINADERGWRYGFVAMKTNGERVYGEVGKSENGSLAFTVPENTNYLWLVVMGAPTKHRKHIVDKNTETDNQWPYQFTLFNTIVDPSVVVK